MAYKAYVVTVGATGTLLWQTTSGVYPDPVADDTDLIFISGVSNVPRPITIVIPSGTTLSIVGAVGAALDTGVPFVGPLTLNFNVVGGDTMYGAISGGGSVNLLVGGV